jgi:UDP-N-acetylglucosamine 2-epimerase
MKMIDVIQKRLLSNVKAYPNLPHEDYLGMMSIASAMIGNTSSGIIEAPSFGLPYVNIGIRQDGRLRAGNTIDVPHEKKAILNALKKAIYDEKYRNNLKKLKNPWGDGHASKRIVQVLETIQLDEKLLEKQITY